MAKKKPYRFFLYLAARIAGAFVAFLPRGLALAMARVMGRLAYYGVSRQRNLTLSHLKVAYGSEKTQAEIETIAKKVFENLAQNAVDFFQSRKFNAGNIEKVVDLGGADQIYRDLLNEGKGVISITAHLGNWELLAGVFGLKGFPGGVLARRIYYDRYNDWVVGLRKRLNVPTIFREDSSREILNRLKRGEVIGLLPDQDIDNLKGVFVEFFGRPAYTPVAPVRLALANGTPMVINFLVRISGDRYRLIVSDVLRPRVESTRDEAIEKYTRIWMQQFEAVIRQYPEQWAWMHNRWKTQPVVEQVAVK